MSGHDAIVVGSGPNGLAAAITLAEAGRSVLVLEGAETIGGGCRSAELTLPGFVHDVCSAVHPLVAGSPFFRSLPLAELGVELVHPAAPLAHPLRRRDARSLLERSVDATAAGLGPDGAAYRDLVGPLVRDAERADRRRSSRRRCARRATRSRWPASRRRGLRSAVGLGRRFSGERARALLAGLAAHSFRPLDAPLTGGLRAACSRCSATRSAGRWSRGGSGRLADAMAARLRALGGEIETGRLVTSLDELPPARAVLLDVTPRQLLAIAGARLPAGLPPPARALPLRARAPSRSTGRSPARSRGGRRSARAPRRCTSAARWPRSPRPRRPSPAGGHPERPYVLLAQQTLADPSRAPAGPAHRLGLLPRAQRVAGGHDRAHRAPGRALRARLPRARSSRAPTRGPAQLERENPNHVGGDIAGGLQDLRQTLARPVARLDPYATPAPGVYLCSSSTPPGGGVHGMCGYLAARSALRRDLAGV